MYVYIETERWQDENGQHRTLTVGFYNPQGKFVTDSDWSNREAAASRVNYLNGGACMRWKEEQS